MTADAVTPTTALVDTESKCSGVHERLIPGTTDEWTLLGRYVLRAELGRGAVGVVHAALDTLLAREVAVKTFPNLSAHTQSDIAGEARALAAIHHPNVVTVYAFHADAEPPFLVMERAAGQRLDTVLHDRPFSLTRSLAILRQIADALDAIHAKGLVHGDVKPANVLVDERDRVKLVDVGLAPLLQRMSPGDVFGTTSYIAPERALAIVSAPTLAARSDVYSFAVLCFEMLAGRRPFLGDETVLLYAHAFEQPPRASEASASLSPTFDEPLARALAKSPERRHASCGALVDDLQFASRGADEHGEPLVVLVADDDPDCLSFARAVLCSGLPGGRIRSCASGAAALELAVAIHPAVIVLDLVMPGLCGVELVAAIHAAAPGAGIVVATGEGSGAERAATFDLGVRSFLVKPYTADELVRAVRMAASECRVAARSPR